MDRTTLIDFFEDVETTEEYNGYLKNVSQIRQWAESERVKEFLKEKFGCFARLSK